MVPSIRIPKWLAEATNAEITFNPKTFMSLVSHTSPVKGFQFERYPPPSRSTKSSSSVRIELGEPLGSGYLWDVYQAKITDFSLPPQSFNAAVKLTMTFTFNGSEYYDDDSGEALDAETVCEAIKMEHKMYTKHLHDLQGRDIPIHYATFATAKDRAFCMILEEVGDPIGKLPAMYDISEEDKVQSIFQAIHDHGVLHGGIEKWNVCKRESDGEIRVIDFHRSTLTKKLEELEWEQHDLKINLGLADTVDYRQFCADVRKRKRKEKDDVKKARKLKDEIKLKARPKVKSKFKS